MDAANDAIDRASSNADAIAPTTNPKRRKTNMETTALYIGYDILGILALAVAAFAVGLVWFAIAESSAIIFSCKWRKRKLSQLKIEMAYNCANYLRRWDLPSNMSIFDIENYFFNKLNKKKDENN